MKPYSEAHYDSPDMADHFDELPLWSAPFGLKLLDAVQYYPNRIALDVGCGTGFPLIELALRLGETAKVYGLDPWSAALQKAREKIDYRKITNIELIEGVAELIPLPDRAVNLVVSNNGVNNVQDLDQTFAEISRILQPGGQFVMTVNLDTTMIEFYTVFEEILLKNGLKAEVEKLNQHIYQKRRPVREFISLLNKNNLLIREMEQDQFQYRFTDGTAMLDHHFIRVGFMDSWMKIVPTESAGFIFQEIEDRLNQIALQTGGLCISVPFIMMDSIKAPEQE